VDKEQIIHDLAMLCTNPVASPMSGQIETEQTVERYVANAKIVREMLEAEQE